MYMPICKFYLPSVGVFVGMISSVIDKVEKDADCFLVLKIFNCHS